MIDGVDAYKALSLILDEYSYNQIPLEQFKVEFDLMFGEIRALPNIGGLMLQRYLNVIENQYECLTSSFSHITRLNAKKHTKIALRYSHMLQYVILHGHLFDQYIDAAYFYGDYGDYEILRGRLQYCNGDALFNHHVSHTTVNMKLLFLNKLKHVFDIASKHRHALNES